MRTQKKSLTQAQVLSRMRGGDLPYIKGGYSYKSTFADSDHAVIEDKTMRALIRKRAIRHPQHTSIYSPWTLAQQD